jgi:hypothetical protein
MLIAGLPLGIVLGLFRGLLETRPVLITFHSPAQASSRSLNTALVFGAVLILILVLLMGSYALVLGEPALWAIVFTFLLLPLVLVAGLVGGLNNGGWFVLLQKVADRRLARAGKLPSRSGAFLKWGIERQIFRRVGGGVRFRHNLIQQHLANTSERIA